MQFTPAGQAAQHGLAERLASWTQERRRQRITATVAAVVVLAIIATVPAWAGGSYNLARYGVAVAYIIAALGLNLAFGYAGELVLGHPVIMAAGAYTAGMLSAWLGWSFAATLPAGLLAGVLTGLLIMSPGLRVQGWYLALITMFAVIVLPRVVILGEEWTGGEFGLTGIQPITLFGWRFPEWMVFETTLLGFALLWLLAANLQRSGWGYRLRALRDARRAAEASGINLTETRFVTYLLCSVPPAFAGVMLAYTERFVNPESFGIGLTLLLLTGVVLGGAGTLWGPIIGLAPLVALSFWVGPFSQYNAVALGLGLLVGTLAFPDGLVQALSWRRPASRRAGGSPAPESPALHLPVDPDSVSLRRETGISTPSAIVVRADGVRKRFGGVQALDGVAVELSRGTLVGLVGPNGSGKSTFLNVLSGFIAPDAGRIELNGADVAGKPVHRLALMGVGRTFQVPQLVDELTALENIEIGLVGAEPLAIAASALRLPSVQARDRARRDRAAAVFTEIGLPESAMRVPAAELSLGLKRVVEVGRAIASSPALLMLDEPAAGLNDEERAQLGRLLRRLREGGMAILLVEHNVRFVMEICDELVLLESGAVTCRAGMGGAMPERLVSYLNHAPTEQPSTGTGR